jgi:AcrR family transcriptional regulator
VKAAVARKEPKQDRARATVETLLEATAQVLVQDGYDKASTNRIAARAGVSVGSLYQYFPSKDALVAAVAEHHHMLMLEVLARAASDVGDLPLDEAVREIIGAMLDAHCLEPALHRVLTEQIPHDVVIHHIEKDAGAFVRATLEVHQSKLRRGIDLDVATFVLVHAVEGVTHAAVLERPAMLKTKALRDEIARMVTRYLEPA